MGINVRSTMDIDANITGMNFNEDAIRILVNEIANIDLHDNISFTVDKEKVIREDNEYGGFSYKIIGQFFNIIVPFFIDISTGDIITPRAIEYQYKTLLEDEYIELYTYNYETIIAEKLQTILTRSTANSRMKDFYEKILNDIENNFGQEAATRENKEEKDLLHWECVEEAKNSKSIEKLHRPMEYLKAKDLRAFKIVIANVPDDAKTENGQLQKIIEERKNAPEDEIKKYNAKCCIELEKDFAQYLLKNTEILQKMGIQILNEGYKRKNKANGYIADHIKFSYIEHPEYTFELQLRSLYIEELSRANGPAAHDKRSGKARIFPNTENSEEFIKQLKQSVPDYTILERAENGYKIKNCTLMENMLEYYLGYIDTNSPEYQKGVKYVRKYMEENKLNKELK